MTKIQRISTFFIAQGLERVYNKIENNALSKYTVLFAKPKTLKEVSEVIRFSAPAGSAVGEVVVGEKKEQPDL